MNSNRQRRQWLSWDVSSGAVRTYLSGTCCRCDGRRRDCGGPCGAQTPPGLDETP